MSKFLLCNLIGAIGFLHSMYISHKINKHLKPGYSKIYRAFALWRLDDDGLDSEGKKLKVQLFVQSLLYITIIFIIMRRM